MTQCHPYHVFPPLFQPPYSTPLFSQTPYFHPHSPFLYDATLLQYAIYLDTVCVAICRNITIQSRCKARFFEWPFSSPPNQSLNWMLPFRLYLPSSQSNDGIRGKTSRFSTKFVIFLYSCVLLQILGTHH